MQHLSTISGKLDAFNKTDLLKELDGIENPVTFFARNDKYEKPLKEATYPEQEKQCLAIAIASVKATGEYDAVLCEWDVKTIVKDLKNFCKLIIDKFNKHTQKTSHLQNQFILE